MYRSLLLALLLLLPIGAQAATAEQLPTIDDYVAGMQTETGYFSFYYDNNNDRVLLQVPKNTTQFILQTSLPWGLGSNDIGLDRGQLGDTRLAAFEQHGQRVLLRQFNTEFRANTDNAAERASIDQAFADSVLWGFDAVAASDAYLLIDYTPYLLSDVHGVSQSLAASQQGQYRVDSSRSAVYLARSKAFPKNTELEAMLTFVGEASGQYVRDVAANADAITLHLHHSFIELPDDNYSPRRFMTNSGFWSVGYQDYAAPLGEPLRQQFIPRHRLQKKDPLASTSEAVQPIIYYLDAGVPEPVKGALLDGAKWWNQAFTAIGYRDAFQVKVLPADADPMDVRYNVIQWVHRATRGWSYGSSIIDPRTGEIIKGHVTLGSLRIRQDMAIAQALLSPFSSAKSEQQLKQAIEQMALARIRQLSAHEIGHTLGIAHNFAASVSDRASVMDYPHPLVSIDTDGSLSLAQAYDSGMGVWDKQVIAYGYSDFGVISDETALLKRILRESKALGLQFISDADARPLSGAHPDAHLWDNGSDAVTELERVLAVRDVALAQFGLDTLPADQPVSRLRQLLVPIYLLHRYQTEATAKMLGGFDYSYAVKGDDLSKVGAVNARQQRLALQQLKQTLSVEVLKLPSSIEKLLLPHAYGDRANRENFNGRMGLVPDPVSMAEVGAQLTAQSVFNSARLNRLAWQHQQDDGVPAPSMVADTLLTVNDLEQSALSQRIHFVVLNALVEVLDDNSLAPEVRASLWRYLTQYQQRLNKNDDYQGYIQQQLGAYLDGGEWSVNYTPRAIPPGSPI
ncbi:zinc-dependent metalloprotease [Idiomarina xiamenensis]|uniref:Extracellular metal-dependent peptidase n=1 Tax=Idiomarina xiamenensis 10-D-4 TaxID=740709 RepID=K2KB91_9GAMM|nr:zinc-dependent metalloprotease [Idiomarina xiamenensis]EKE83847.1 extracellular metal-dependent peptidase [Idiomarina xiamenensis 10-D-4]